MHHVFATADNKNIYIHNTYVPTFGPAYLQYKNLMYVDPPPPLTAGHCYFLLFPFRPRLTVVLQTVLHINVKQYRV